MASDDSPVVANWKAAGAVIIGRTNTPGFSFRLDTENDLRGRTYSPWSETHTPGGSSGGAASSVAAGITPLSHGNDIAGSIRFPGLRVRAGRPAAVVRPRAGVQSERAGRTVDVVAAAVGAGADGPHRPRHPPRRWPRWRRATLRDPWWVDMPLVGPSPPRPIRVAVVTQPEALAGERLHPTVAAAMRQAVGLRSPTPATRSWTSATPGFTRAMELWFAMQVPEIRVFLWPAIEQYGDLGIQRAIRLMFEAFPGDDGVAYMKALAERARVVRDWQRFLDRVPLVLAPVCTQPVYTQGFDVQRRRSARGRCGASASRSPPCRCWACRAWRCRPVSSTACRPASASWPRASGRICASRPAKPSRPAPA